MSYEKLVDPFSFWKNYYKQSENYWRKTTLQQIEKEEFSEWFGKVQEMNLIYRQMIDKSTKQYLQQMNIPSRDEIASLASLVVNLDSKVDQIEENLEENLENQIDPSLVNNEITQIKQEIKEIDQKLEEIINLLKVNPKSNLVKEEVKK